MARIVADYAADHQPGREAAWIAEHDGRRVGCVFCVRKDDETAQLRILLVTPRVAGRGWGSGSSTAPSSSLGRRATGGWCCGPTIRSLLPVGSTTPASAWSTRSATTASVSTSWGRTTRWRCDQVVDGATSGSGSSAGVASPG